MQGLWILRPSCLDSERPQYELGYRRLPYQGLARQGDIRGGWSSSRNGARRNFDFKDRQLSDRRSYTTDGAKKSRREVSKDPGTLDDRHYSFAAEGQWITEECFYVGRIRPNEHSIVGDGEQTDSHSARVGGVMISCFSSVNSDIP